MYQKYSTKIGFLVDQKKLCQWKLAKVRVSTRDFQYIHQTQRITTICTL
jgi:hypothetical protein